MNQFVPSTYVFFFLFFMYPVFMLADERVSYRVLQDGQLCMAEIDVITVRQLIIGDITYATDTYCDSDEFFYLLECGVGDCLDKDRLVHTLENFQKKNKFLSIDLELSSDQKAHLHFIFQSAWTFKKVKIHGVFQRKYIISQAYIMTRGDAFDHSKHNHSIVKIKELLCQDGYYNNRITTHFEHDYATKEVVVHVTVNKGKRFAFGKISVELSGDEANADYSILRSQLMRKLFIKLSSHNYKATHLNQVAVDLKKYLGRRGFVYTDFELEEYKDVVSCCVDVNWKINVHQKRSFVFFGNRFFSKNELLEKILAFGRSAWLLPASLLAEEIITLYKQKGFWDIKVETQEEKGRSFFVIQEGSRALITDIEMHNVQGLAHEMIKKKCFKKILRAKYYDAHLLDDALRLVAQLYLQEGYLSCRVIDYSFVKKDNGHNYTLLFAMEEGKQRYITSVTIEGYPALSLEGPFKQYINNPILFDMKLVEAQRIWLTNYFHRQGYVHVRVKPHMNLDNEHVAITWHVDLGEQIRFGKTIVVGSTAALPFSAIQSLLAYQQDALWDQDCLKRTFKAFKELDIFESITLVPNYTDKNQNKTIMLKLHADDVYEVRARAGLELQHVRKYQTFNGLTYKLGGTTLVRNPFKKGDIARLDLDFARSHREVVARYRCPLFFTTPMMGTFQIYSMSYDQPGFIGSVNDVYTLTQNGFSYGLERKTTLCKLGIIFGCEGMATKIKDPLLQESLLRAINFKPQLVDKTVPFFYTEPTVVLEYLDNALNPTSGTLTLCSLKTMIPFQKKYKDTLFFKLLFEQSLFVPLHSVVAAFRLRLGHIFYRELSAIMPSERFYLGGSHSIRGYEADLAPPLGVFVDEETNEHVVPRGGKSMCNINAELRFPIFNRMGGVVFQDLGLLSSDRFADFKPRNILAATGFGARFFTPLGPLRFDIGWKWRRETKHERSYAWFLTFGQAF